MAYEFKDIEDFQRWLNQSHSGGPGHAHNAASAIAVRAALRATIEFARSAKQAPRPIFRLSVLSWAAARYPHSRPRLLPLISAVLKELPHGTIGAAALAIVEESVPPTVRAIESSLGPHIQMWEEYHPASDYARSGDGVKQQARQEHFSRFWKLLSDDADLLDTKGNDALMSSPLGGELIVPWVQRVIDSLPKDGDWSWWIDWYRGLIDGKPLWSENASIRIASLADETWAMDPTHLREAINDIVWQDAHGLDLPISVKNVSELKSWVAGLKPDSFKNQAARIVAVRIEIRRTAQVGLSKKPSFEADVLSSFRKSLVLWASTRKVSTTGADAPAGFEANYDFEAAVGLVANRINISGESGSQAHRRAWRDVEFDANTIAQQGISACMSLPLWPIEKGNVLHRDWSRLKDWLNKDSNWDVWLDWYNAICAGQVSWPDSSIEEIINLPDEEWARGAVHVNARIKDILETLPPPQSHGPHLAIRDGRIVAAPRSDLEESENNISRLQKYWPLLRDAAADFEREVGNRPTNDSDLQRLRRWARSYSQAIEVENLGEIDFEFLAGLGTLLQNRLDAPEGNDQQYDISRLSQKQRLSLKNLCDLHAYFITSSKAGLALIADAERQQRNPQEEHELRGAGKELADQLRQYPELVAPETVDRIQDAAENIGVGKQAERATLFGIGALRNTTIVLAAGGILASLAPIIAMGGLEGVLAGALALCLVEGTKKSKPFVSIADKVKDACNFLGDADRAKLELLPADAYQIFAEFIVDNQSTLRKIAGKRPEFRWLHKQIDIIVGNYIKK